MYVFNKMHLELGCLILSQSSLLFSSFKQFLIHSHIGLDKGGYPVNIFLKHMLWVLIRSASMRRLNEYPQRMFSWRNKKNINTFGLCDRRALNILQRSDIMNNIKTCVLRHLTIN